MSKELSKQQKRMLQVLYYQDGNFIGQKRLFELTKEAVKELKIKPIESRQVLAWLKKQEVYQLSLRQRKVKNYRPIGHLAFKEGRVFQMDFTETKKVRNFIGILVAVDVLSKKIYTQQVTRNNQKNVISMIEKQLPPTIKILMSDNGSEFIGASIKKYLKDHKIVHITGKANVPSSQGLVERANQSIKTMLEKFMIANKTTDWTKGLKQITANYNDTFNRTIMMKPNDINSENAKEIVKRLREKYPSYKNSLVSFNIGDLVRKKILKQKDKFAKGYTQNWTKERYKITNVRRRKGVYTYRIEDGDKPYYKEDLQLANIVETNPFVKEKPKQQTKRQSSEEVTEKKTLRPRKEKVIEKKKKPTANKPKTKSSQPQKYVIEKLVSRIKEKGRVYFEVKWQGYSENDNTLEPRTKLMKEGKAIKKMVLDFEK